MGKGGGICGSSPDIDEHEKKRSAELDAEQQRKRLEEQSVFKLLLLGAGESGKSTLFKQMFLIYGTGFTEEELMSYRPTIFGNILDSMKMMIQKAAEFAKVDESYEVKASTSEVEEMKTDDPIIDTELAKCLQNLWKDRAIKAAYDRRSEYQLTDSTNYYLDKILEVCDTDDKVYKPSETDVLRSRARTTGVIENKFEIKGNKFRMYDVGGQRSERKKWIHCFENVTAVLFVAALSAYDQVLYEDATRNRMTESLALFGEITNNRYFERTSIILFLNKRDLFQMKIKKGVPITKCDDLQDYEGEMTHEAAADFIQEKFVSMAPGNKEIYPHFTCATDTNQVELVFEAVKDIIIKESLKTAGLLS